MHSLALHQPPQQRSQQIFLHSFIVAFRCSITSTSGPQLQTSRSSQHPFTRFLAVMGFGLRGIPTLVQLPVCPRTQQHNCREMQAKLVLPFSPSKQEHEGAKHEFINRRTNLSLRPPSPLQKGKFRAAAPSPGAGGGCWQEREAVRGEMEAAH